jgi:hypothetical protein
VKPYILNSNLMTLNKFLIKNTKYMKINRYMKIYLGFRPALHGRAR